MYERDNIQANVGSGLGKGCKILLIATFGAFVLQIIAALMADDTFSELFGLSGDGIRRLHLWQLVTYMFVHSRTSLFHIIFNMLGLYVFGRDVEDMIGTVRFLLLYLICGVVGGLLWLPLAHPMQRCIGASGAVLGLLGTFAAFFPQRKITLLIFFVLPVTLTARTLAIGFAVISLLSAASGAAGGVAHLAHLGGLAAGVAYGWRTKKTKSFMFGTEWSRWNPFERGWWGSAVAKLRRKNIKLMDPDPDYRPEQEEVDRILEKVSTRGMTSLSEWERHVLDRASKNGVR